jgi:MFS family permease
MPKTDPKTFPKTQNWLIFLMVAIGIFMATLDGSIVNIALPSIMADFAVPLATIQWVVMIYLLTVTSLLLSFGRLSDIRGRRMVYSLGLCLFSLGSFFCAIASTAHWLIGARFFQGLGAAMTMACTPALIVDTFPERERGRAIGMMGSVVASGLTVPGVPFSI